MIKSFHNRPIDTTGILSWNVPDETLYTVQSNFLGFLIICKVSSEAKLEKLYFSVIRYYVSFPWGWGIIK